MDFAFISVPAAPVRRKPTHRKEMVNQLLFGETVRVLKTKGDLWIKVRSLHDHYEGWITRSQVTGIEETEATTANPYVAYDPLNQILWNDGTIKTMSIPFGSSLPAFDGKGNGKIFGVEYSFAGGCRKRDVPVPFEDLKTELISIWLHAPYLWGGRTPLGVDCSGLVQVIYKTLGMDLSRDAWQQAQEGKTVKKFSEVKAGDLAFFDNKEAIIHTGILIGDEKIMHSSGKVKIDNVTRRGVYDATTGKKILSLRLVKRVF